MCELSLGAFAMSLTNVRGQPKFRVPQNVHGVSSPQEDNLVSLIPEPNALTIKELLELLTLYTS